MSAPVTTDTRPYLTDVVTVSDLLIQEFNNWTNSKDSMLSPTTSCWCRSDLDTDPVE
jgi:hypothetical protein